jgi:hypothetical protein
VEHSKGNGGERAVASSSFLLVMAATCCSWMERLEVLVNMVDKTVEVRGGGGGRWRILVLG